MSVRSICAAGLIFVGAPFVSAPVASAATIECGKLGSAYDNLFSDGNKRIEAVLGEFKALPANADAQQKDAVRKKFCATGGELVGYYKFIQTVAQDCAAKGEKLDQLLDVINKQLGMAQSGIKSACW